MPKLSDYEKSAEALGHTLSHQWDAWNPGDAEEVMATKCIHCGYTIVFDEVKVWGDAIKLPCPKRQSW